MFGVSSRFSERLVGGEGLGEDLDLSFSKPLAMAKCVCLG